MSSAIKTPPKAGRLYWTAYTQLEGDSSPTDPLRLDMYAERLGNVMLPGITNRTERLRYFGMVCAGLALTRPPTGGDLRAHTRLWRQSFLPFEAGWALANIIAVNGAIKDRPPDVPRARLKLEFQGFRGANRVQAYFQKVHGHSRIKPHGYRLLKAQEAQGGLGAYLVALRRYGLVQSDRFDLTARGSELATAFLGPAQRGARRLLSNQPVTRSSLRAIGDQLLLSGPSSEEARLVRSAIFSGSGEVATVFKRLPANLRKGGPPEDALRRIARPDGSPLERAAHYALEFDPFRRAALLLFCELGRQLTGKGVARIRDLEFDALDPLASQTQQRASALANLPKVEGLEPIATLATRIAGARSNAEVLHRIVVFHREEGRRWIDVSGGSQYTLGAHGSFADPADSFHGYTLRSAMRVYADMAEALR